MIVPFLPLYLLELGANQNNIEFWTAVIFSVSFFVGGVMAPLWGKLADKKGQKSMSVRSSAMLCIAYLCGGIVVSPLQLLGMRVLQGFANGYLPSVLSRVSSFSPTDKLGSSLGFIQSSQLVGTVSGPLIGGVLAHLFGMRSSFFIAGTFLLIVFLVTAFVPGEEIAKNNEKQEKSSIVNDFKFTVKDKNLRELLSLFFLFSLVMLAIQPILSLYVGELIESREDMAFLCWNRLLFAFICRSIHCSFLGKFRAKTRFLSFHVLCFFRCGFFPIYPGICPINHISFRDRCQHGTIYRWYRSEHQCCSFPCHHPAISRARFRHDDDGRTIRMHVWTAFYPEPSFILSPLTYNFIFPALFYF